MRCSLFVLLGVCLYSTSAYDFNYPSKPEINVTCDNSEEQNYVRLGEKYYFRGPSKVNWFEAAHICRKFGGDLALIESEDEMAVISNYLESQDKDGWYWISGNDLVTVHKFMSIADGLPLKFTSWSAGQPDFPGKEQCMHLWFRDSAFRMNNWKCTEKAKYLCQRQNYTRCSDSC
ncbi:C-type lectin 37Db-like [Drosophila hydei]|uniref:C-type lectin 37Db-like n=1 Tax=Drosophila hydei TaxID=7224 RepID=A0A6J1M461_DROHY|nr:C-type lectin 37Db-like [Drosophila hydei]